MAKASNITAKIKPVLATKCLLACVVNATTVFVNAILAVLNQHNIIFPCNNYNIITNLIDITI